MVNTTKWLIFTVLLGVVPILARLVVSLVVTAPGAPRYDAGDLIAFGLLLVVTDINYLEHQQNVDPTWKTTRIGFALVLALLLAVLFTAMCFNNATPNVVDGLKLEFGAVGVLIVSAVFSVDVVLRLSRAADQEAPQ